MKKVALITGASSGIGKDITLRLIGEEYVVYGAARRLSQMNEIVEQGGQAIEMDILKEEDIVSVVQKVMKQEGRIDVLINNAGYGLWGAVETLSIETARRQFDVNIFGLASLTKKVIPIMRAQKFGKIINMSSMGGRLYTPLGAWYHATKHALEGWSDCLRIELKDFGIDVILIEPGAINTDFGSVMMESMLEREKGGPYEEKVSAVYQASYELYEKKTGSAPSVISDLILRAINSKNPKTRYVGGRFAKPMLFIRKWFGEKAFEKAVMSQMNNILKRK